MIGLNNELKRRIEVARTANTELRRVRYWNTILMTEKAPEGINSTTQLPLWRCSSIWMLFCWSEIVSSPLAARDVILVGARVSWSRGKLSRDRMQWKLWRWKLEHSVRATLLFVPPKVEGLPWRTRSRPPRKRPVSARQSGGLGERRRASWLGTVLLWRTRGGREKKKPECILRIRMLARRNKGVAVAVLVTPRLKLSERRLRPWNLSTPVKPVRCWTCAL